MASESTSVPDVWMFGWYSTAESRLVGFDVYEREGQLFHVTALVVSPKRYQDIGDEVFVGMLKPSQFVRRVLAEPRKGSLERLKT